MNVRVSLNINNASARITKSAQKAVLITSEQALKDCNYYCKEDQDGLISSSEVHSELEKGILRWQTPYARMQYYLDAALKEKNPNARKMWAHYAASKNGNEWLAIYQKAFKEFAKER